MKPIFTLCSVILLGLPMSGSYAADLNLNISGATPANGQFLVSVFAGEASWMKQPVQDKIIGVASNGTASTSFELPPGIYGIAIVHDVNRDGKINVNGMGIPIEAFGFSNNAKALFGPPKFKRASFEIDESGRDVEIRLGRAK